MSGQPLVPSEIPPLMEARYPVLRIEGLPENKTFTNDGSFKVVFDRVLSGFPQVKLKGGKGAHGDDQGAPARDGVHTRRRRTRRWSFRS